jgi:putative oxidoreductase
LIYLGVSPLFGPLGAPFTVAQGLIEATGGTFLLAGLWTPMTAGLIAIDELWIAFSLESAQQDSRLMHFFLAALTAGVAMLGPGAWSIDARLFGRKRFKMADRSRGKKPSL